MILVDTYVLIVSIIVAGKAKKRFKSVLYVKYSETSFFDDELYFFCPNYFQASGRVMARDFSALFIYGAMIWGHYLLFYH